MTDQTPKRLFIKTYGCQMNVYDSQRMAEAMGAEGYVQTDRAEDADMVLLNTCHIREKAAEKLYSDLGRLKPLKSERPDLKIGVAGCVAQAEGDEIIRRMPLVDLVVGPQAYHRLPAMARGEAPAVDTDFPAEDKFDHLPERRATRRHPAAFLTVQEGCDKFCTYCVVPYTRGAEVSRPWAQVMDEARSLVDGLLQTQPNDRDALLRYVARNIARRFARRGEPTDDLEQEVGEIGDDGREGGRHDQTGGDLDEIAPHEEVLETLHGRVLWFGETWGRAPSTSTWAARRAR